MDIIWNTLYSVLNSVSINSYFEYTVFSAQQFMINSVLGRVNIFPKSKTLIESTTDKCCEEWCIKTDTICVAFIYTITFSVGTVRYG